MYEIYVATRFEAAHRLVGDFGPATRMHGHTYRMEVIVRGQHLGDDGTLYDIGELGQAVEGLAGSMHYRDLNESLVWRKSTRRPRRSPPTVGKSWPDPSAARGSTRSRCASGSPPTPTRPAKTRWPEGSSCASRSSR